MSYEKVPEGDPRGIKFRNNEPIGPWDEDAELVPAKWLALYKEKPWKRCRAHRKSDGRRCPNLVVNNYQVCRIHGSNHNNPGGHPPTTGKTSDYLANKKTITSIVQSHPDRLVDATNRYQPSLEKHQSLLFLYELHAHDPEITSLRGEIAVMRARLSQRLDELPLEDEDQAGQMELDKHIAGMTDKISALVERHHKIEFAEHNIMTLQATVALAARIATIINDRVSRKEERELVGKDLARLFGAMTVGGSPASILAS